MWSLPRWVYLFVTVSVAGVWALANLLDPILSGYSVPDSLNYVMGALVGLFGAGTMRRNGG